MPRQSAISEIVIFGDAKTSSRTFNELYNELYNELFALFLLNGSDFLPAFAVNPYLSSFFCSPFPPYATTLPGCFGHNSFYKAVLKSAADLCFQKQYIFQNRKTFIINRMKIFSPKGLRVLKIHLIFAANNYPPSSAPSKFQILNSKFP